MKKEDLFQLRTNSLYKFVLYYGEEKTGILVESIKNPGIYFIIPKGNLEAFNNSSNDSENFGDKVLLEAITSWDALPNYENKWSKGLSAEIKGENKRPKKMIIFGAGASFDFSYADNLENNDRPPLTNNLFDDCYDDILNEYPGARVLSSQILTAPNVEVFFQEQWDDIKNHYDPDALNKLINTQYYFHQLFLHITEKCKTQKRSNYISLAQLISKYTVRNTENVLLVSFNYDTLLEKSLETALGLEYSKIEDYIDSRRSIYLLKPHGSCNWLREFSNFPYSFGHDIKNLFFSRIMYQHITSYGAIFQNLKQEIIIKDNPSFTNNDNFKNSTYLPQLLIPYTDKDEFVMPLSHRQTLEENLESIGEILIIGWKGTERIFQELLRKKLGTKTVKVTIVNNGDQTVINELNACFGHVEWQEQKTFSEFIKDSGHRLPEFFNVR